jgi:hypothetical protein
MKAWQEMIEQFQKAGFGSYSPEFLQMMFAPMQQQLDLLQKALRGSSRVPARADRAGVCSHAAGLGGTETSRKNNSRRW